MACCAERLVDSKKTSRSIMNSVSWVHPPAICAPVAIRTLEAGMARLGAPGGAGWTRTSIHLSITALLSNHLRYRPIIPLARPASPVRAPRRLCAAIRHPLPSAQITMPHLPCYSTHGYIVPYMGTIRPLFRRPGDARDDLHWAAPVAGNRRFFAVYLRVELPYHLR